MNLAQHLVSTIHIVKGTIVDRDKDGKIVASETTQWSSYRDLTNRIFYFRTYDNFNMRKIDLKRLDFTGPRSGRSRSSRTGRRLRTSPTV